MQDGKGTAERTIRLFVSSTFRDMAEERELLTKRVFPEVRRVCEERGVAWSDVDLRWGVTEEQAAEGDVLPICLSAVDRCRPFFVGLLGERYGWVPDEIPGDLLDREPWLGEKRGKSVTELEIEHGVLRDPAATEHAFFYLRDPRHSNGDPGETAEHQRKLSELKDRIRRSGAPVREDYQGPDQLAGMIRDDLIRLIDELYPRGEEEDPRDAEIRQHEAHAAERAAVYVERGADFDALDAFADDTGRDVMAVLGESGSGKSALLASWALRRRTRSPGELVLTHFVGATLQSTEESEMLRRLNRQLAAWSGVTEDQDATDADSLRREFARLLSTAHFGGPVTLVVDGLNQLEAGDAAQELGWLPLEMPQGVHLLVSALPGPALEALGRRGWLEGALEVMPLSAPERTKLIERYLEHYSKRLDVGMVDEIAGHPLSDNPLFLRSLLDELRVWGRHETLGDHLRGLLRATTLDELFTLILARYEGDYQEGERPSLVGDAMSLIWAARSGLVESELLDLLGPGSEPLPQASWAPLYFASGELLIERDGVIDFAHDYFRQAVARRYLDTAEARRGAHRELAAYMRSRGPNPRALVEAPWQLAEGGDFEGLAELLSDPAWFLPLSREHPLDLRRLWALVGQNTTVDVVSAYPPPAATELDPERADFSLAVSNLLHDLGEQLAAEPFLMAVLEWAVAADSPVHLRSALIALGDIAAQRGNLDGALRLYTDHERHAREAEDLPAIAAALGRQAHIHAQRGLTESALELRRREQEICRAVGDQAGLAASLGGQAGVEKTRGEAGLARELLAEQERIFRSLGDDEGVMTALSGQIELHLDRDELGPAADKCNELERIARETASAAGLADALFSRSSLHRCAGEADEALRLNREAEAIYRRIDDPTGLQAVLGDQGVIVSDLGDSEGAMRLYQEQEAICRRLGLAFPLQLSLGNQATYYMGLGDAETATRLLLEQERICRSLNIPYGLALSLTNQAAILESRGAAQAAKSKRSEALKVAGGAGLSAFAAAIGGDETAAAGIHLETAVSDVSPARRRSGEPRPEPLASASAKRLEIFREKLLRPLWIALPLALGAAADGGGSEVGEGFILAAVVEAILAYRFWKAAGRESRDAFYVSYAQARGLEHSPTGTLPDATPLLRAGQRRRAAHVMNGRLPGGLRGALGLYSYELVSGEDGESGSATPFTVVLFRIPEAMRSVREVYVAPRSRKGSIISDYALVGMRPLVLESLVAQKRYEIVHGANDDPNWLRQLFSPTFVLWLAEESPKKFGFELSQGYLCAYMPGHVGEASRLDALVEAAEAVARRVVSEARE